LQDKSSTCPNPTMDAAVFTNFRAYSEVYKWRKRDIQKLHQVAIPTHKEPMNLKTRARSYGENIECCAFWNFRTDFIAEVKQM
jgi:ABC-type antimicrobial peptide transport system ATPase subunit